VLGEGRTPQARITEGDTMRNPDSSDLDTLLRSAAPVRPDAAAEEGIFSDAWSRVQTSIRDGATTSGDALQQRRLDLIADRELAARRRRRAARVASLTLAVAVAGAGTAAAAEYLSTRTGEETTGWEVGAAGPGELLDLGGTDRRQVFEDVTSDIPFAPGYDAEREWALDFFPVESDSLITESGLRSWIASNAICTWADAWVADDDAGDVAARAAAAETLAETISWEPIRTFNEAHGEPDPMDAVAGGSYYGWLLPLAEAAGSGDRQGVLDAVADGHVCSPDVMPVISADPASAYYEGPR
jgi:hypothetical protein